MPVLRLSIILRFHFVDIHLPMKLHHLLHEEDWKQEPF